MRTRNLWLVAVAAAGLLGPACRKPRPIDVPTPEAEFIPRDIAVQKLRDLLPTSEQVISTVPKDTLSPSEIREWNVGGEGLEIRRVKGDPIVLRYAEITRKPEMVQSGRYFAVRIFSSQQKSETVEHLRFLWRQEKSPKDVVELLEALRR